MLETYSVFPEDNSDLGKVYACTSSKSGAGKSTIAYLTSIMIQETTRAAANRGFRHSGSKVVFVDLELSIGQVGGITGATEPSVSSLNHLEALTPETVSKALTVDKETGITLLLAPTSSRDFLKYTPDYYKKLINVLQTMFDVVMLNISEEYGDIEYAKMAYTIADKVIVAASVKPGGIYGLARWMDTALAPTENNGLGIKRENLFVVFNQVEENTEDFSKHMAEITAGVRIITAVPESENLLKALGTKEVRRLLLNDVSISTPIFFIVASLLDNEIIANPLTT